MNAKSKVVELPGPDPQNGFEPLYRVAEIARMLHISRASVYNLLRGEQVIDLGRRGKKGIKLVSASVLRDIVERKTKTFR
jgi:hypothetical protein